MSQGKETGLIWRNDSGINLKNSHLFFGHYHITELEEVESVSQPHCENQPSTTLSQRGQQMAANQEDGQNQYKTDVLPANNFRSIANELAWPCYSTLVSNSYRKAICSAQHGRNMVPLK